MEGTPPIEPRRDAGEVDGAEEVGGAFVLARSDGPVLLQLGNEVLDRVARFVEALGPPRARGAVGNTLWRTDGGAFGVPAISRQKKAAARGRLDQTKACHGGRRTPGRVGKAVRAVSRCRPDR